MTVSGMTAPAAAAAMIAPAERVMTEIEAWRVRFERGELRPSMPGRPSLAPDERFAVDVGRVRAAGLGNPAAGGVLHATDRRAVMFAAGWRPCASGGSPISAAVSALGNWGGPDDRPRRRRHRAGGGRGTVVAHLAGRGRLAEGGGGIRGGGRASVGVGG